MRLVVGKKKAERPKKLTDKDFFQKVELAIEETRYLFTKHATERAIERGISPADVLRILKNEKGFGRKRNKEKDKIDDVYNEWNYCVEGKTVDQKIRIIVSFDEDSMPIITVIEL